MVVTVHGKLDQHSAEGLITVLRDVIYDQANRAVIVDLRDVSGVDASAANLFRDASGRALRRGVSFRLYGPPAALADALIGTWLAQEPGPDPPVGR